MRINLLLPAWILLCFCWLTIPAARDQQSHGALSDLLPRAGDVEGWIPDGDAQCAAGEDLFLLIDGGAEIYHEYGFLNCLFQTYSTDDGRSINIEIYEMDGPEAAYGIFTFKRSRSGIPVGIGQEGSYESYYLIFWRGRFLLTVIALGEWDGCRTDILQMARAFDAKLDADGMPPRIISYLPAQRLRANGITYIKGNLALFHQYLFAQEDIFGVKEGVTGEYEDHSVFIFQYRDENDAGKWFASAKAHLAKSRRFDNYAAQPDQFELDDRDGRRLTIKHFEKCILIAMTDKKINTRSIFESIEASIKHKK